MKILHIFKTEPDKNTEILAKILSEGEDATIYRLYEQEKDYEELIDLIFAHDNTISWW